MRFKEFFVSILAKKIIHKGLAKLIFNFREDFVKPVFCPNSAFSDFKILTYYIYAAVLKSLRL